MIDLKNVSVVIVDDYRDNPSESNIRNIIVKKALKYAQRYIIFGDVLEFSPLTGFSKSLKRGEYEDFFVKELPWIVTTDYYINFQWDGFIVNPQNWNPDWFKYDFIGGGHVLQNGGFSFRKTKTMQIISDDKFLKYINGFNNSNSFFANEDSYYSMFFKSNASNIEKIDNRIQKDWYEFIKNENVIFNEPFNPIDKDDESCASFNFSSFYKYNSNAFGWHWSGTLDIFTILQFYKKLNIFTEEELAAINTYLRSRIKR